MIPLVGVGEELRNKRIEKGLSLEEVETATKIRVKYLEAIENENFDLIPGRVYVKGFIKNYAKFLGVDYTGYLSDLSKKFKEEESEEDILSNSQPNLVKPIKKEKPSSKIIGILVAILIVLVIGFFAGPKIYDLVKEKINSNASNEAVEKADPKKPDLQEEGAETPEDGEDAVNPETQDTDAQTNGQAEALEPESGQESQTPAEPADEEPANEEPPAPVQGEATSETTQHEDGMKVEQKVFSENELVLAVTVMDAEPGEDSCWLQIIADGELVFEETIHEGSQTRVFSAKKEIKMTYGNGGAISASLNGKDQGVMGAIGEVGKKIYTLDNLEN